MVIKKLNSFIKEINNIDINIDYDFKEIEIESGKFVEDFITTISYNNCHLLNKARSYNDRVVNYNCEKYKWQLLNKLENLKLDFLTETVTFTKEAFDKLLVRYAKIVSYSIENILEYEDYVNTYYEREIAKSEDLPHIIAEGLH